MINFLQFLEEAKSHKTISRDEFKARLDAGEKFTKASLYEPEHAPKGTEFVHVKLSPSVSHFLRARGKDHPVGPGVFHKDSK